jgi:hypothetical protein
VPTEAKNTRKSSNTALNRIPVTSFVFSPKRHLIEVERKKLIWNLVLELCSISEGKVLCEVSGVDQKISECVDTALKKLGENVNRFVYSRLEKDFNLERFEIPRKPEAFEKAITAIFGEQRARTVEKLILAEIRRTFHLKKSSASTLKETIKTIRNSRICKLI